MGRLIIAEKHSVAQAIAAALGGGKAEDGWIGCGADAVTWAQGHLVDLLTPDEYQDRGWDKWSMDALPLDPTGGWKWKVNRQRGADRQYRVVAGLLKSDAYDVLVNACDPDREGESIFHRIVSYAGTRKPMLRLWVASLEEDAIRDALDSMRSEDEYRGLAEAADIRAKADWLIGMNASRAYTLVYHRRMSVGRVQTPTLAMVADRDRQIAHHVEKPFWKVVVPMGGWTLTGERLDDRTDAEALKSIVDAPDFTFQVFSVQRRTVHERPPRLYDLTGLQKDMSRLHGLTAAHAGRAAIPVREEAGDLSAHRLAVHHARRPRHVARSCEGSGARRWIRPHGRPSFRSTVRPDRRRHEGLGTHRHPSHPQRRQDRAGRIERGRASDARARGAPHVGGDGRRLRA